MGGRTGTLCQSHLLRNCSLVSVDLTENDISTLTKQEVLRRLGDRFGLLLKL